MQAGGVVYEGNPRDSRSGNKSPQNLSRCTQSLVFTGTWGKFPLAKKRLQVDFGGLDLPHRFVRKSLTTAGPGGQPLVVPSDRLGAEQHTRNKPQPLAFQEKEQGICLCADELLWVHTLLLAGREQLLAAATPLLVELDLVVARDETFSVVNSCVLTKTFKDLRHRPLARWAHYFFEDCALCCATARS